jgi:cyclophilin family peptidyl-prolyl cis-trans isomerase
MQRLPKILNSIFDITSPDNFNDLAMEIFHYQYAFNKVYKDFTDQLGVMPKNVQSVEQIPFMPVEFFKEHKIITGDFHTETVFYSSGTTGNVQSKHYIIDTELYKKSFTNTFMYFYGNVREYYLLALLPSYLERKRSSLIYMINELISQSRDEDSGFYMHDHETLAEKLRQSKKHKKKLMLFGVSFALMELVEKYTFDIPEAIIIETGGMKGKREEIIREELHSVFCKGFGVKKIHSEYGMTELLSQAYSKGDGLFKTPPWMKILIRDLHDPFSLLPAGKTGPINIIDLANIHSCSFLATQDLGRIQNNGSFEVLGRIDESDVRGCSLMV